MGNIDYEKVSNVLTQGLGTWKMVDSQRKWIRLKYLCFEVWVWMQFICARILLVSRTIEVTPDRTLLIFAIMEGFTIDVGQEIQQEILENRNHKHTSLIFPNLITQIY
ncbi:hypothetical protein ACH5RR_012561 [Cinchona calisaya]|uniref:Putative plant transposon protein domain-containing protein n=1 Tax=Cinchona calisaya TaxID=153742 RepID=A0ABD3ABH5_9GENT